MELTEIITKNPMSSTLSKKLLMKSPVKFKITNKTLNICPLMDKLNITDFPKTSFSEKVTPSSNLEELSLLKLYLELEV